MNKRAGRFTNRETKTSADRRGGRRRPQPRTLIAAAVATTVLGALSGLAVAAPDGLRNGNPVPEGCERIDNVNPPEERSITVGGVNFVFDINDDGSATFTADAPFTGTIILKAGNEQSGGGEQTFSFSNVTTGTVSHTFTNQNGDPLNISHIDLCNIVTESTTTTTVTMDTFTTVTDPNTTTTVPGSTTTTQVTTNPTTTVTDPNSTSTVITNPTTTVTEDETTTVTGTDTTSTVTEDCVPSTVTQAAVTVTTTVFGSTTTITVPGSTITETGPPSTVTETVEGSTVTTTVPGSTVTTTIPGSTVTETVPGSTSTITEPGSTSTTTVCNSTTTSSTLPTTTSGTNPTTAKGVLPTEKTGEANNPAAAETVAAKGGLPLTGLHAPLLALIGLGMALAGYTLRQRVKSEG